MKGANGTGRQRRRRGSGNPVAQMTSNFLELTKCRRRHFAVKKIDFAYDLGRGQNLRRSQLSEHSGFCSVVRFRWAGHRVQLRAFETRTFHYATRPGRKFFWFRHGLVRFSLRGGAFKCKKIFHGGNYFFCRRVLNAQVNFFRRQASRAQKNFRS